MCTSLEASKLLTHSNYTIVSGGEIEIKAYPNPFKEIVNIEIVSHLERPTHVKIYDIIGVELLDIELTDSGSGYLYKAQIKELAQGIYFCNIYAGAKLLDSKKLISAK
ncbi:MAG: T9SS type A sorting domain-containing protein [Cytophagales bacterium]|nr:T9SS type A sorting domain-containing protein [Cytophagales bacterium]